MNKKKIVKSARKISKEAKKIKKEAEEKEIKGKAYGDPIVELY